MTRPSRVQSVDAVRGLAMVLMALDHVRDFFHAGAMVFQPDDLTRTTTVLFFTRWITHICAPSFAFLAGVGAFLWLSRGRTVAELSRFLWTRGLWLVLLDLTAVRFAMFFSLTSGPVLLNVLWSLGWSMVALGFLVRLPPPAIAAYSLGVLLLHNVTDSIPPSAFSPVAWLWNVLHVPGAIPFRGALVITAYPLLPWTAVMSAGYCYARVRSRLSPLALGAALTLAFLVLRFLNLYGDPQLWSHQPTLAATVLSFLRTTKYPPSLLFLLMTLGPALLLWAFFDRIPLGRYHPIVVFGRVPLFYFVVHLVLIHALTYPFALFRYGTMAFLGNPLPSLGGSPDPFPPGYGYSLTMVYLVLLLVLLLMYPPCLFFARLKDRRRDWWLSYL